MSGMFEVEISWIWSLSRSLRRLSRAISSWSPIGSAESAADPLVELAVLGLQRFEFRRRIVVVHRARILPQVGAPPKPRRSDDSRRAAGRAVEGIKTNGANS